MFCGELPAMIYLALVQLRAAHLCTCSGQKSTAARVFPLMYCSLCKQLLFLWLFDPLLRNVSLVDSKDPVMYQPAV